MAIFYNLQFLQIHFYVKISLFLFSFLFSPPHGGPRLDFVHNIAVTLTC